MSTVTTLIKAKEIVNQGIFKGAPYNNRFDQSILAPNIHLAEDRFLKTFICKAFYEDLVAQKNTIPSNYNAELGALVQAYPSNAAYETLWTQYLLPYLSRAVLCLSLPSVTLQVGNNGVMLNNSEYAQNSGLSGMKFLMDNELSNTEQRKPIIIKFLCDNKADYPLFCRSNFCECSEDNEDEFNKPKRNLGIIFYNTK